MYPSFYSVVLLGSKLLPEVITAILNRYMYKYAFETNLIIQYWKYCICNSVRLIKKRRTSEPAGHNIFHCRFNAQRG